MTFPSAYVALVVAVGLGGCASYDTLHCSADRDCTGVYAGSRCNALGICVVDQDGGVNNPDGGDGGSGGCALSSECPLTAPICGVDNLCHPCSSNNGDNECTMRGGVPPHCQLTGALTGQCTGCRIGQGDCSTPTAPVCGVDNVCRGCTSHDECTSLVCNTDGSCADMAAVTYVDNHCLGTTHDGGFATPYCEITDAIAANKHLIRVAGNSVTYKAISVSTGSTTTIVGPPNTATPRAIINGAAGPTPAVTLSVNGATTLVLDGIEITDSTFIINGIFCSSSSAPASLTIRRSYLHDLGLLAVSGTNCAVTIDRSKIARNSGGGINLTGGSFSFTNSFFVANGPSGAAITLGTGTTEISPGASFVHNTVADNLRPSGFTGGVVCATAYVLNGSILSNNTNANAVGCTVAADSFSTMTLTDVVYEIPNVAPFDYRLKAANLANQACCVDKITPALLPIDYFGTGRPQGTASDRGAHEQ